MRVSGWYPLTEPVWGGWYTGRSCGGNPRMTREVTDQLECDVSWGPVDDHALSGEWGPSCAWYVDLEAGLGNRAPGWETDPRTGCVGHIERGFATREEAEGAAAWLRSCVEVAGEAGLRALNARSGGRLA